MTSLANKIWKAGWFKAGLILSVALCSVLLLTAFLVYKTDSKEILIESLESKTVQALPVYNKIKYIKDGERDIWMMNQSHSGRTDDRSKWERLAIVVEGHEVSFYQIESGLLEWSEDLKKRQVPYRVSCFMCHTNGPRTIRPTEGDVALSWSERVKLLFWNTKIKLYGRLHESAEMKEADLKRETPFRHHGPLDDEPLNIQPCMKCHKENGFFARGVLTRQNRGTIQFMVQNKIMPPPGFSMTAQEEKNLNHFLRGF